MKVVKIWLNDLKQVLSTPNFLNIVHHSDIYKELYSSKEIDDEKININVSKITADILFQKLHTFLCIWEAPDGCEFILTDRCFGSGDVCYNLFYHSFYVISPKIVLVLTNKIFNTTVDTISLLNEFGYGKSIFDSSYNVVCTIESINDKTYPNDNDKCKFKYIKISKEAVNNINSITLDKKIEYISYKSNKSMYNTLKDYNKNNNNYKQFIKIFENEKL